jgi:protein-S-isoprenylcysteine O-methyltransferase Ste14
MTVRLLNEICWIAFVIIWVIGALYNSLNAPATKQRRFRFDWLIFAALFWLTMRFPDHYFHLLSFHVSWLQWLGSVILVSFTAFTIWSRFVLGKMWAANAQVKEEHKLVIGGPYQVTRNPIYTGILGMIIGSALSLGQGAVFIGFIAALIFFKIRIYNEELLMKKTFGDEYLRYQKQVPRLLPRFTNRNRRT